MLSDAEKAYCRALMEVRRKNFETAAELFDGIDDSMEDNKEFVLYRETVRLLMAVRKELTNIEKENELEITEEYSRG